jgi:hypothetical protein
MTTTVEGSGSDQGIRLAIEPIAAGLKELSPFCDQGVVCLHWFLLSCEVRLVFWVMWAFYISLRFHGAPCDRKPPTVEDQPKPEWNTQQASKS